MKDYDMIFIYHGDKANVFADALSQISLGSVANDPNDKKELVKEVHRFSQFCVCLEILQWEGLWFIITVNHL